MSLQGTVTIITGAGRGIGRAMAQAQAEAGAKVGLIARSAGEIEETAALIRQAGGTAETATADVTDLAALHHALDALGAALGPADLMINNAGLFAAIGPVWEIDADTWWRDVETNVRGVFNGCRAVLPGMIDRGKGRVINLCGGGTAGSMPFGSGYGSSKAAVMRFTECLDDELDGSGVLAFPLDPGLVETRMTRHQLDSDAGRRFMPQMPGLFEQGINVPPTRAAGRCVEIGEGRHDRLHGRLLMAIDDVARLESQAHRLVEGDLRTLRITELELKG